ncbi:hypothetical protein DSECCO2_554980 [anaerobic digester metagenome]
MPGAVFKTFGEGFDIAVSKIVSKIVIDLFQVIKIPHHKRGGLQILKMQQAYQMGAEGAHIIKVGQRIVVAFILHFLLGQNIVGNVGNSP